MVAVVAKLPIAGRWKHQTQNSRVNPGLCENQAAGIDAKRKLARPGQFTAMTQSCLSFVAKQVAALRPVPAFRKLNKSYSRRSVRFGDVMRRHERRWLESADVYLGADSND
jgi:hypothetical protein